FNEVGRRKALLGHRGGANDQHEQDGDDVLTRAHRSVGVGRLKEIRLAGWRRKASPGQTRAMEHSLQFTQRSWRICRKSEPLPKRLQPSTHFAQPIQSFSSIEYS